MKETKFYCDHCGKELDAADDYTEIEIQINYGGFDADLCKECVQELKKIARIFCKKEAPDA